jgi:endoglucanase
VRRLIVSGTVAMALAIALARSTSAQPSSELRGPLSTDGAQIVDADHHPIRILSAGTWAEIATDARIEGVARAGFNAIRLDWANRSLDALLPSLDRIIATAARNRLVVILNNHSNESGAPGPWKPCFAQQRNGLWYDSGGASDNTDGCDTPGTVSDAKFMTDWQTIARHYKGNPTVIGYDLRNEPLGYRGMSTWEPGDRHPEHNIRYMYERVGNAILAIDPTKLIICEGPLNSRRSFANDNVPAPWGDLSLAGRYPVQLTIANRLVYSVHDYPASIGGYQPDSGFQKVSQMNATWGYLVRDGLAPVWIGEAGANMTTPEDRAWAQTLVNYTNGQLAAVGGPDFAPGQTGIGIDWWFAGHDPDGQPKGIFDATGQIDPQQQATYLRFR